MLNSTATTHVAAALMCSLGLCISTCPARSFQQILQDSQNSVSSVQPYRLNTDIRIPLKEGQAVQLDCESNPYGLEKYIVYYYADENGQGIIRIDAHFDDGTVSGGGSRIELDGALRQARNTPCLAIARWEIRDGQAHVEFCASDDLERNHREYTECKLNNRKMSLQYTDKQLIGAVELPEVQRLAGFARLWSEVQFNFVFFDRVPELDWHQVLVDYIPKVQAAKTDVEYYRVLRHCIALLKDGHTGISGPSDEPSGRPPLRIRAVEGRAVVVQVCPADQMNRPELRAELAAADLRPGDEITHIDGRPVQQILTEQIYPYIAASTPQQRDLDAYSRLAQGEPGAAVTMRIRDLNGNERQVRLTQGHYSFPREERPFLRELADGILHINLDSFGSDRIVTEFQQVFDKVLKAKGLVLDVRHNGGGSSNVGYGILKTLIDAPVEGSHWKTRQYRPAFRAWGRDQTWHEGSHGTIEPSDGERYRGPVVVLTGAATASAAEDFVVAFQTSARGKVVGERTMGSTGQPLQIGLPGGGSVRICTKWDTYPDGREFMGIGCIPDVEIEPTRQDIAAGRDVVLEKAMDVLRSQMQ